MTRPLVVRFGALGDMVLMTVAIRRLSVRFGSCVDVVSSGDWTEPLLKGQSGVGDIYLLRGRGRPFWAAPDQWQLVRALRRRGAGSYVVVRCANSADASSVDSRWLGHGRSAHARSAARYPWGALLRSLETLFGSESGTGGFIRSARSELGGCRFGLPRTDATVTTQAGADKVASAAGFAAAAIYPLAGWQQENDAARFPAASQQHEVLARAALGNSAARAEGTAPRPRAAATGHSTGIPP